MSIRAFRQQGRVREDQFYGWEHKLRVGRQEGMRRSVGSRGGANFTFVNDVAGRLALAASWRGGTDGGYGS